MPTKKQRDAVLNRLKALVEAIDEESAQNTDFFYRIEEILLSPDAIIATQKKGRSNVKTPTLNILEMLHLNGESEARKTLGTQTNIELAKLASAERAAKLNEAKSMEREALIDLLIEKAHTRLKQGETFTKSQSGNEGH